MKKEKVFKVCKQCNTKKRTKEDFRNALVEICLECTKETKRQKRLKTMEQRRQDVTKATNFRGFYVYRFLDKDDNVIYIGKTTNFEKRMEIHFGKANYHDVIQAYEDDLSDSQLLMRHGHLDYECYKRVKNVEKINLKNQYEMDILEIHFINKFKSEYNVEYKYDNVTEVFDIPEPMWLRTVSLQNLKERYLILSGNTKLYDKIAGSDKMIDVVARNLFKTEEELIKMCDVIKT